MIMTIDRTHEDDQTPEAAYPAIGRALAAASRACSGLGEFDTLSEGLRLAESAQARINALISELQQVVMGAGSQAHV